MYFSIMKSSIFLFAKHDQIMIFTSPKDRYLEKSYRFKKQIDIFGSKRCFRQYILSFRFV
ncbi:hypothetical protein M153_7190004427, partial [Pseudoloma neurophilia]